MTVVLGLTGSVAMGKSATAALFRARGVPVHDADRAVHALYAGPAVAAVAQAFPAAVRSGRVDRTRLAAEVFDRPDRMRQLEAIVHPLVRAEEEAFLARHRGAPLLVLDIPLLFETGGERRCDLVAVVTAPADIQRERVMARPGMTAERFEAILARQMPDREKRRRAHAVIDTSRGFDAARMQVDGLVRALAGRPGRVLSHREWAAPGEADRQG